MPKKVQSNQFRGPGLHESPDQTTSEQPIPEPKPGEFPKYLYHPELEPVVVSSREEQDALEGYSEKPHYETHPGA